MHNFKVKNWLICTTRQSLVGLLLTSLAASFGLTVMAQEDPWAGQRVVPLLQEPRHRTVHKDGDIYLLDVQLNPGDTSLPHTHSSAILLTYISNAEGPIDGRVSSNVDYASEEFTHQISNAGPGLFRIIALTSFTAGQSELTTDRPTGLDGEPQLENPWFRSYRVELAPGQETALQTHQYPSVVVQVSNGISHVSRADGITAELNSPADWTWRDAGSSYSIRNPGTVAVTVVINEARR